MGRHFEVRAAAMAATAKLKRISQQEKKRNTCVSALPISVS